LMYSQIETEANNLLEMALGELLARYLEWMQQENHLRVRMLPDAQQTLQSCYYSKSLYYEEECAAVKMRAMIGSVDIDQHRVAAWVQKYCQSKEVNLSGEQASAV
jgi:exodeoxyribonuclease V alpha subunit